MSRKVALWAWFDSLARLVLPRPRGTRVAVVRLDAIGDFIVWQPYARFIREAYPGREIVLVCNAANRELAEKLPYWDRVIPIDVRRSELSPRYRFGVLRQLRREGFDVALNPAHSRTANADLLIRASGARERLALRGDDVNLPGALKARCDGWYTRLIPSDPQPQPEWERGREFAAGLMKQPALPLQPPALPPVGQAPAALADAPHYFVLFPGASSTQRRWPLEHFAAVGRALHTEFGWIPVLAGGPGETALADQLQALLGTPCINLVGRTPLSELAECVRGARFLLSNETSAIHIAAAVRTPSVCILGGGHYGRFMPYPAALFADGAFPRAAWLPLPCQGCNWMCTVGHGPDQPAPCVRDIPVADVLRLAREAVQGPTPTGTVIPIGRAHGGH